ncbi:MAG: helix-turn-helix transcriptional regulator [Thomasclavelia sp.]
MALKVFVSRQTISNWETNKSCPDIKSLIMLSDVFNVSLDNFIKEDKGDEGSCRKSNN